ncbi:MAG: hypothetical protein WCD57_19670 [Acidobacteriaceae bacterium]
MPKNEVSDLITDQEIAYARLVLSGTMTDREAAREPQSRCRAYMLEYRAAVQQQILDREKEKLRRKEERREHDGSAHRR